MPGSGLLHPGRYFAGLAAAADRAGADLHEGVRARTIRRQADGRFVVETERGAILARDVFVATNGYTDGVVPTLRRRIIPIGSYIIATEPLPEDLAAELSPKGRAFFDTKNFLYYWHVSADRRMVFGGRASFLPTSIEHTAAILHRGLLEVHPQLAGRRIDYAWGGNVGFTFDRMPHAGRTKDGVAYAMGCCGTGVALMTHLGTHGRGVAGGRRGAGPGQAASSRSCRRRTRAGLVPAVRRRVVPAPGSARRAVAAGMRIGFRTSPQKTDWASLEAAWAEAGRHDVFDSGWLNDHLTDPGLERGGPSFEAMTTLAALAHHVPGKSVGQTVLAATFRHPAMLAKEALTLDHVTGGRFILGLGAGWHVGEHEAFGIDLPPLRERFDRFEATVRVLKALFSDEARQAPGVTLDAPPFRLDGATMEPGSGRSGGPPLWLGGQGPRGLRIAARYADGWNYASNLDRRPLTASRTARLRCFAPARRSGATRRS